MPEGDRIKLVVLFGGQSAEHEVSCTSALNVLRAADRDHYELVPVGITREGRWVAADDALAALEAGSVMRALPSPDSAPASLELEPLPTVSGDRVVVLPLLHGPMGEDGTVQGLCELAGVPYVGAGVAASAVCMDKGLAKAVLAAHGIPQCRWWSGRAPDLDGLDDFVDAVGFPLFAKPANLGSSVGVSKAHDAGELRTAVDEALRYDEYLVLEEAVAGREIELAVLGNEEPRASVPGEVVPGAEFYDYDDKYTTEAADLRVPADLPAEAVAEAQRLAVAAYRALQVDGMARVDFFYEEQGRGWLVNELNTIPGFTPISMYPKLWEASGLPYAELVDELVRLAVARHARRAAFARKR